MGEYDRGLGIDRLTEADVLTHHPEQGLAAQQGHQTEDPGREGGWFAEDDATGHGAEHDAPHHVEPGQPGQHPGTEQADQQQQNQVDRDRSDNHDGNPPQLDAQGVEQLFGRDAEGLHPLSLNPVNTARRRE
jgi:hypothetical protein